MLLKSAAADSTAQSLRKEMECVVAERFGEPAEVSFICKRNSWSVSIVVGPEIIGTGEALFPHQAFRKAFAQAESRQLKESVA